MFVRYAVVPALVFAALLLNIFHLPPTDSAECGQNFTTCEDCLCSTCHTELGRPCTLNCDMTLSCFTCEPLDAYNNKQFYSKEDCEKDCEDPTKCLADGKCFVCACEPGTDVTKFVNDIPTTVVDEKCNPMPYVHCSVSTSS